MRKVNSLRCVQLFVTPMDGSPPGSSVRGSSRQAYRSGLPFPSPGTLTSPRREPGSPALQADSIQSGPPGNLKIKMVAMDVTRWSTPKSD